MNPETERKGEHDAVLRVIDFDRSGRVSDHGPSGKDFAWNRTDNQPILSPDEHEALEDMMAEAHERYEIDELEHHDVVARIWLRDRTVESVEWEDQQ